MTKIATSKIVKAVEDLSVDDVSLESLATMVSVREIMQTQRMAFNNRIKAIERGDDEASPEHVKFLITWFERFNQLEIYASSDIDRACEDIEIIKHITSVKGLGNQLTAQLVSIVDITIPDTVSGLWKYCGYGVTDGVADRPRKGEKISYNPKARQICYNIGSSFLKTGSPYRAEYDRIKTFYEEERDWTKLHIHNASLRKMIKLFLSHLYERWRELEGLPVRKLYVVEKMGHSTVSKPEDYGWCSL